MKRMIDTGIWIDARVDELGSLAKLLWLYILTSPQGNLAGCFEMTMRRVEVDTGIKSAQARKLLDELGAAGLVGYSEDTCEVLIVKWGKHNWSGGSSKLEKPLANAIVTIKSETFREYLACVYREVFGKPIQGFEELPDKYPIDRVLGKEVYPPISISISNTLSNPIGVGGTGGGETPPESDAPPDSEPKRRFRKPTVEEIAAYAAERGAPSFDAEYFHDHYESNGWYVGRNKMRDWKAAVRKWLKDSPGGQGRPIRSRREVRTDARFAKYD